MRGFGALCAVAAGVQLVLWAAAGCNEPIPTSFGNPNTLDRKNLPGEGGVEQLACGGDGGAAFDGGCPNFERDLFPYFKADGKWQCSSAACHGQASAPAIDGTNAAACLASLKAINVTGKPYISGDGGTDPTASSLLCNLQGSCGSRMPKPPAADPTGEELCMVEAWLKCGAPR